MGAIGAEPKGEPLIATDSKLREVRCVGFAANHEEDQRWSSNP